MDILLASLAGISISSLILGGTIAALIFIRRKGASSAANEAIEQVKSKVAELESAAPNPKLYVSKKQIQYVEQIIAETLDAVQAERSNLEKIEKTLEDARREVEQREAEQQEHKVGQEEEERMLEELLARFDQIQSECQVLEENLANSLKRLDQVLEEMELTQDQQSLVQELSQALEQSGGLLMEMMAEHKTISQKLSAIKSQLQALEEEYTRLVEQQLAG